MPYPDIACRGRILRHDQTLPKETWSGFPEVGSADGRPYGQCEAFLRLDHMVVVVEALVDL
jgi:hypothetical protein